MFADLERSLGDKIENAKYQLTESIDRVEQQTTKTNGRVTKLEAWIEQAKGAMKLGGTLLAIIVGLLIYIWHTVGGF